MIHLLFTGGTISMQRDPAAGGNVPAHGGEALVAFAPGLERDRAVPDRELGQAPGVPSRSRPALGAARAGAARSPRSGEVSGIVVTHGTDTLEETAYLLARTLPASVPVAITGAMRTSSDEGWDGPRNLLDAARVAAEPGERGPRGHGRVSRPRSSPARRR